MKDITFIHTADIHLGRKFKYLGEKSKDARSHLYDILDKIAAVSIDKSVDFVLISGDLFDDPYPSPDSISRFMDFADVLDIKKIKVVILPGTHDLLKDDSVFSKPIFSILKNVYIFNKLGRSEIDFDDLSLALYGYASDKNKISESPVTGFSKNDKYKYHIIMAHGSVQIEGKSAKDDSPIEIDDIEKSFADYIALGHWHQNLDFSKNSVPCFYSGSPELIDLDQKKSGFVMYGNLDKKEFIPIKTGERFFDEMTVDISSMHTIGDIIRSIKLNQNPNLIRKVNIVGEKQKELFGEDLNSLKNELSGLFYYLYLDINTEDNFSELSKKLSNADSNFSSVEKIYIEKLEDLIRESKNIEDKKIYESALEIGYALLNGKKVF
ncbi:MAG: metallophosphoesterase family protein [Patescibacteria group bacterium]